MASLAKGPTKSDVLARIFEEIPPPSKIIATSTPINVRQRDIRIKGGGKPESSGRLEKNEGVATRSRSKRTIANPNKTKSCGIVKGGIMKGGKPISGQIKFNGADSNGSDHSSVMGETKARFGVDSSFGGDFTADAIDLEVRKKSVGAKKSVGKEVECIGKNQKVDNSIGIKQNNVHCNFIEEAATINTKMKKCGKVAKKNQAAKRGKVAKKNKATKRGESGAREKDADIKALLNKDKSGRATPKPITKRSASESGAKKLRFGANQQSGAQQSGIENAQLGVTNLNAALIKDENTVKDGNRTLKKQRTKFKSSKPEALHDDAIKTEHISKALEKKLNNIREDATKNLALKRPLLVVTSKSDLNKASHQIKHLVLLNATKKVNNTGTTKQSRLPDEQLKKHDSNCNFQKSKFIKVNPGEFVPFNKIPLNIDGIEADKVSSKEPAINISVTEHIKKGHQVFNIISKNPKNTGLSLAGNSLDFVIDDTNPEPFVNNPETWQYVRESIKLKEGEGSRQEVLGFNAASKAKPMPAFKIDYDENRKVYAYNNGIDISPTARAHNIKRCNKTLAYRSTTKSTLSNSRENDKPQNQKVSTSKVESPELTTPISIKAGLVLSKAKDQYTPLKNPLNLKFSIVDSQISDNDKESVYVSDDFDVYEGICFASDQTSHEFNDLQTFKGTQNIKKCSKLVSEVLPVPLPKEREPEAIIPTEHANKPAVDLTLMTNSQKITRVENHKKVTKNLPKHGLIKQNGAKTQAISKATYKSKTKKSATKRKSPKPKIIGSKVVNSNRKVVNSNRSKVIKPTYKVDYSILYRKTNYTYQQLLSMCTKGPDPIDLLARKLSKK